MWRMGDKMESKTSGVGDKKELKTYEVNMQVYKTERNRKHLE